MTELENHNEENTDPISIKESRTKLVWKKYWKFGLGIVVALGLIVFLIVKSDPSLIWDCLIKAKISFIFPAIGCMLLLFLIKTVRWQLIIRPLGYKISFFQAMRLVLIGTFGSSITPAKVGDVLRAFYLTKEKKDVKIGSSVFSVVFDRLLDLAGIFVIVGISVPFAIVKIGFATISWWVPVAIGVGFLVFIFLLVITLNGKISKPILNFLLKYLSKIFKKNEAKAKIEISSQEIINDFYDNQRNYHWWQYLIFGSLSVLFWILLGVQGSLLLEAFNISIFNSLQNILIVIAVLCVAAIASMAIPISISGIGVRDSIIMIFLELLFTSNNLTKNTISAAAINLSILQTFMNVLLPGLLGGLLILLTSKTYKWRKELEEKPTLH